MSEKPGKLRRGMACMSPEKRRAIASLGGRCAHAQGKVRGVWTREQAIAAAARSAAIRRAKKAGDSPT